MQQKAALSALKNISAFLAAIIPVIQFGFKWFPEKISGLFINQDILFFTMMMAFLFSIFAIYFALLDKSFYIGKKFFYSANLTNAALLIVFLLTIFFTVIGTTQFNSNDSWLVALQSIFYMLIVSFSVYLFAAYSIRISIKKKEEETKRERPRKAINLAMENDAFENLPRVSFIRSYKNEGNKDGYTVEVQLGDKTKYKIVTDDEVEELKEVILIDNNNT